MSGDIMTGTPQGSSQANWHQGPRDAALPVLVGTGWGWGRALGMDGRWWIQATNWSEEETSMWRCMHIGSFMVGLTMQWGTLESPLPGHSCPLHLPNPHDGKLMPSHPHFFPIMSLGPVRHWGGMFWWLGSLGSPLYLFLTHSHQPFCGRVQVVFAGHT